MAVEYLNLLVDSTKDLSDAQRETNKSIQDNNEEIKNNTELVKELSEAKKKETTEVKKSTDGLKLFGGVAKSAASEFVNAGKAGIAFGQAIGVTATRGVQLELTNRTLVASQLGRFSNDLQVTIEQLKGAQQGFSDVFIGAAEGMQISAQGSLNFARDLKKGFGSEFEATPATFRMMIEMGMANVQQMEEFRKATGRAGLSSSQLATLYGKNTLSFLLYGNSFAKAAVEAQRLGINLAGIQAAQESLVTNLDGTIDTVAQINQLGGQIDFGSLIRIAEQEGPDALMAYVRATVPEQLMQSASTRALFKQLGISVEDYLKSGTKQVSAADQIEKKFTEVGTAVGLAAEELTGLTRSLQLIENSIGQLKNTILGTIGTIISSGALSGGMPGRGGVRTNVGGLTRGVGSVALGASGAALTQEALTEGRTSKGLALGAGAGAVTMGALALMSGGTAIPLALLAKLLVGGALAGAGTTYLFGNKPATPTQDAVFMSGNSLLKKFTADDMMSGYGSRTLVTPSGMYALNNADDIIAGTNLFPKGALSIGTSGMSDRSSTELINKINELVAVLQNSRTTINIDNKVEEVPRMALVGVYTRNERR